MAIVIASFLILTMVVARNWLSPSIKLDYSNPLDIDARIPFPEAGQGSSIFSLTALFGPYLAMFLLLGLPSIIGMVIGSLLGLYKLRLFITKSDATSFHDLLCNVFDSKLKSNRVLLILIACTQIGFAASELLILRGISTIGFNMDHRSATIFVISLSLIAYFYSLDGGYLAVYRTDILQFIFILFMGLWVTIETLSYFELLINNKILLGAKSNFWFSFGAFSNYYINILLNIIFSFTMGFAFIIASPDTWKRVFVVTVYSSRSSMWLLILSGLMPFLIISPLVFISGLTPEMMFPPLELLVSIFSKSGSFFTTIFMIGIIATFMSSFDSALVAASHLAIISHINNQKQSFRGINGYYNTIGMAFLAINAVFALFVMLGIKNSYYLANLLLIFYAIGAGLLIGAWGVSRKLNLFPLLLIIILPSISWIFYLGTLEEIILKPGISQIGTIPLGVIIGLIITLCSFLLSNKTGTI